MSNNWLDEPLAIINDNIKDFAIAQQQQLTKPAGSLGRLEDIAIKLAAIQHNKSPVIDNIQISVFAADHGIATQNISAFPQAVTVEMIKNFSRGGAAINVLSRFNNAKLNIVNCGTVTQLEPMESVIDKRVAAGTKDFSQTAAMTVEQCQQALTIGANIIDQAKKDNCDLFIAGEMGISNTSSATALVCAVLNKDAKDITGPGTGLDTQGIEHKVTVINNALNKHQLDSKDALTILQTVGGFEIAAITGAYIRCAQLGICVLVDGFICSAAALVASRLKPGSNDWFIYAHASAEPGHKTIMQALDAQPLIDLGLRLGEGSGAAVAIPLLKSACALHNQMASFADAGVSEQL